MPLRPSPTSLLCLAATLAGCVAPPARPEAGSERSSSTPRSGAKTHGTVASGGERSTTAPEPPQRPEGFDPAEVAAPPRSVRARVLALEAEGRHREAIQLLQRAAQEAETRERPLLQWIEARLHERTADRETASTVWKSLAASSHPLAPWATVRAAETLLASPAPPPGAPRKALAAFRRHGEEALALAERALDQGGDAVEPRARWLRLRARLRLDPAEGLRALRQMAERQDAWGSRAAVKLATRLQRGSPTERLEALRWWARLARRDMDRAPGRALRAAESALALAKRLPRRVLARTPGLRYMELERLLADALLAAGRARLAAKHYAAAVRGLPPGGRRWCEGTLGRGRALYRARARREAIPVLRRVAGRCRTPRVRAVAWFLLGRSLAILGRYTEAQRAYATVWRRDGSHSLADDARYRAARAAREAGDTQGFLAHLRAIVAKHPHGDMRPHALFRLAMAALESGKPATAIAHLDALGEPPGEADREGREGRSAYWRSVALLEAGREQEARKQLAALARRFPLSYHGRLALQRLASLAPPEAKAIEASWRPVPSPLRFPQEALPSNRSAFERALALLRVREDAAAMAELRALGLTSRQADPERQWLVVALLEASGAHGRALQIARRLRWTFFHDLPRGPAWRRWRLAYPEAMPSLVEQAAGRVGIDPALLFAVAREESGFDPRALSRAGAQGLTQLMPATARRMAERLGLPPPVPRALREDPQLNLRLGAAYLGWLRNHLGPARVLTPAAYNAGERALLRWLRAAGAHETPCPFDRFVEAIPYDETRRYSRRVLQSHGVYAALRGQKPPPLPARLSLPAHLGR